MRSLPGALLALAAFAVCANTYPVSAIYRERVPVKSVGQAFPVKFEVAGIFDAIFQGPGGLKRTCNEVWSGSSSSVTIIERTQCRSASKEIEFAKLNYPGLLEFVSQYINYRVPQSITSSNAQELVAASNAADRFTAKCNDPEKTATRSAKTMEYWGTSNVGDWYFSNLAKMGADRAAFVLEACNQNSWAFKLKEAAVPLLTVWWEDVRRRANAPSSPYPICQQKIAKPGWSNSFLQQVQIANNSLESEVQLLEGARSSSSLLSSYVPSYSEKELQQGLNTLKANLSACQRQYELGRNTIALKEREEMQRQQKQVAAAAAAKQQAAINAEQSRQRSAAAAAAAESAARKEAARKRSINGVRIQ